MPPFIFLLSKFW